jgi:hypothetical protein
LQLAVAICNALRGPRDIVGHVALKGRDAMGDNVKILKTFYTALENHDWAATRALLDDNFRFRGPNQQADSADAFIATNRQINSDWKFRDLEMIDTPILSRLLWLGQHKGPIAVPNVWRSRMAAGSTPLSSSMTVPDFARSAKCRQNVGGIVMTHPRMGSGIAWTLFYSVPRAKTDCHPGILRCCARSFAMNASALVRSLKVPQMPAPRTRATKKKSWSGHSTASSSPFLRRTTTRNKGEP